MPNQKKSAKKAAAKKADAGAAVAAKSFSVSFPGPNQFTGAAE